MPWFTPPLSDAAFHREYGFRRRDIITAGRGKFGRGIYLNLATASRNSHLRRVRGEFASFAKQAGLVSISRKTALNPRRFIRAVPDRLSFMPEVVSIYDMSNDVGHHMDFPVRIASTVPAKRIAQAIEAHRRAQAA